MNARQEMIDVHLQARALLALPGNDFSWSSWEDSSAALSELDGLIAVLEGGQVPRKLDLSVLFAPTGPIQEASLSSGWANVFLELAAKYDDVEARVYKSPFSDEEIEEARKRPDSGITLAEFWEKVKRGEWK